MKKTSPSPKQLGFVTILLAVAALLLFKSGAVQAQQSTNSEDLDPNSAEALEKTKNLLINPVERAAAIKGNADAQSKNADVERLAGSSANVNSTYGISAGIFEKMVKDSGGNGQTMQYWIEQAQRDPTSFYNKLTPEQKKSIEALSKQIEATQGTTAHP